MKKILFFIMALALFLGPMTVCEVSNTLFAAPAKRESYNSIDNVVGHYNNKIKIVFSDIDGTLLPFNKNTTGVMPSVNLVNSVQKLKTAGIPLILVTGRAGNVAQAVSDKIGATNSYLIGYQGTEILDPSGKIIYKNVIEKPDVKKIVNEVEKFNKINGQDSKVMLFGTEKIYIFNKFHIPYLFLEEVEVASKKRILNSNDLFFKIEVYETDSKKLKAIQQHLKKTLPDYRSDIVASAFIDIYHKDASKGEAVKKLSEILQVDLKNAATLGDAENDISMLDAVKSKGGMAIAVGNAMDKVKSAADYVTSPVTEDGFSKAVDKIIENNKLLH